MKVLVTGAAGFVGQYLIEHLLQRNHEAVALIRPGAALSQSVPVIVEGDLRDPSLSLKIPKDIEAICHVAAVFTPGNSQGDVEQCLRNNILGTLNVVKLCFGRPVKRIVYSSSASVYEQSAHSVPVAEDAPLRPETPYAISKLVGEWIVASELIPTEVSRTILRYSSVFGLGQRRNSVLPILMDRVLQREPPTVYGTGRRSQDFVYVEDVCAANLLALEKHADPVHRIYNIGSGSEVSMSELARSILTVFDASGELQVEHDISRTEPETRFCLDVSSARADLGYAPRSLLSGLDDYKRALQSTITGRPSATRSG